MGKKVSLSRIGKGEKMEEYDKKFAECRKKRKVEGEGGKQVQVLLGKRAGERKDCKLPRLSQGVINSRAC